MSKDTEPENSAASDSTTQTFLILSAYEADTTFYEKIEAETRKEALEAAIRENHDEDLLPVKQKEFTESGFIVVPADEYVAFSHR